MSGVLQGLLLHVHHRPETLFRPMEDGALVRSSSGRRLNMRCIVSVPGYAVEPAISFRFRQPRLYYLLTLVLVVVRTDPGMKIKLN